MRLVVSLVKRSMAIVTVNLTDIGQPIDTGRLSSTVT
jgi:hypothetical protein